MNKSSLLIVAAAAVCLGVAIEVVAEVHMSSPTKAEIEMWMNEHSFDDADPGANTRFALKSEKNTVREHLLHEWEEFADQDPLDCSIEAVKRLSEALIKRECYSYRLGEVYKTIALPKREQQELLRAVSEHAHKCPATYEKEIVRLHRATDSEILMFVDALKVEARSQCDPLLKYNRVDGDLQPWRPASAEYYECVRRRHQVFTEAIKKLEHTRVRWQGHPKEEGRFTKQKAEQRVAKYLEDCKHFMRAFGANHFFLQVCREFLARETNADVIGALVGFDPMVLYKKQSNFSKIIGKCSSCFTGSH